MRTSCSSWALNRAPSALEASRLRRISGRPPRVEIVCPRCDLHFSPEKHTVEIRPGERSTVLLVEEEGYSRDATSQALAKRYDYPFALYQELYDLLQTPFNRLAQMP